MKLFASVILIFAVTYGLASYVSSLHQCIVFNGLAPNPSRSMVIESSDTGVYVVTGSVNGVPAKFMIDTGASYTSLSENLAKKLGFTSCDDTSIVESANGEVTSCSVDVNSLVMGKFEAKNVTIQYLKTMADISVIGNDFLSHFRISIYHRQMIISL